MYRKVHIKCGFFLHFDIDNELTIVYDVSAAGMTPTADTEKKTSPKPQDLCGTVDERRNAT